MTLSPTIRRYRTAISVFSLLMAVIGVGSYLLWLSSGALVREGNWVAVDFHTYYAVAHVLSQHGDIYSAGISPPYVYPPLLGILVLPLASLPVNTATIIWKVLQHICLLASGAMLVSLVPREARILATGVLLFGWALVPVQDEVLLGESNSLVLLLVVGAIWLTAHGTERENMQEKAGANEESGQGDTMLAGAGVLLALAASIKVLPLVLVAYFWWRGPRRVAIAATVGFVVLQLASLLVTPSTLRYWFVEFPSLFGQAFPFLDNQSLNAAISRALLPTDPSLPNMQLFDGDRLRAPLTWLANLLVLAAVFLVLRPLPMPEKLARSKDRFRVELLLEVGLVLLTIHLVSGSTWMHHLVDLCAPLCGLLAILYCGIWVLESQPLTSADDRRPGRRRVRGYALLAVGLALLLLFRHAEDWLSLAGGLAAGSPLAVWAISNSGLWSVLLLWITVLLILREMGEEDKSILQPVA